MFAAAPISSRFESMLRSRWRDPRRSFASLRSRGRRRSVCHRLLGSFSDSLPASWSAGSSSGEGVIVDTP